VLRPPLSAAVRATATLVREWDSGNPSLATLTEAKEAAAAVTLAIHDHRELGAEGIVAASAAALDITRMLAALSPGITRDVPASA